MQPALTVMLNGRERRMESLVAPAAIEAVLATLSLQADRVAVELNGEIIARRAWPQTAVQSGDRLEIVHFVGGGSAATVGTRPQS